MFTFMIVNIYIRNQFYSLFWIRVKQLIIQLTGFFLSILDFGRLQLNHWNPYLQRNAENFFADQKETLPK